MINLMMSRGICLIMDINIEGCEVTEQITRNLEVNPWMISTLKNENPFEA